MERAVLGRDRCLIERDRRMFSLLNSDFFIVGARTAGNMLLATPFLFEGVTSKMWLNEKPVVEFNLVFYYNPDKKWIAQM